MFPGVSFNYIMNSAESYFVGRCQFLECYYSLFIRFSYFQNIFIFEFRRRMVFSSSWMKKFMYTCVKHIVFLANIFKIRKEIVFFVAVFMVYLKSFFLSLRSFSESEGLGGRRPQAALIGSSTGGIR